MFVPAFERMVALVRGRVRLPDNWDALHSDEQKDFKRNRFAVGDTLLDAASAPSAVRSGACRLAGMLQSAMAVHDVAAECLSCMVIKRAGMWGQTLAPACGMGAPKQR